MKKKKRVIIILIVSALLILSIKPLLWCTYAIYLTEEDINGFYGLLAVRELKNDNNLLYVELPGEPTQLVIRQSDVEGSFESAYFDSYELTWSGSLLRPKVTGIKNG